MNFYKKISATPLPPGSVIDSFNSVDDKTANAPSIRLVGDTFNANFAQEYNGDITYPKGSYCMHNKQLYKARVVTGDEDWNASKWDATDAGTELTIRTSHVGQIIMSTTLNNENAVKAIYGGNSWELLTDKFLVGAGNSYSVKATGGEATHTLTTDEMPSHNHGGYTSQDGWHTHNTGLANDTGSNANMPTGGTFWGWNASVLQPNGTHSHTISAQGSGQAHNNLPPYYAVYIWHRVR